MARYRTAYHQPGAPLPTYGWHAVPAGLLTRRQLRTAGLQPAGSQPVARLMWAGNRCQDRSGRRWAWLYDIRLCAPRRPCPPSRRAACQMALAARRICPDCHLQQTYVIPKRFGCCLDCHDNSTRSAA